MRVTTFLVSKDPVVERTGDTQMLTQVMRLARASRTVRYLGLGRADAARADGEILAKPGPSRIGLLPGVVAGRSLVHRRFDVPALRERIAAARTDAWVADHAYMAEPLLATSPSAPVHVNTVVSESLVWRATHGALGRQQAPRILRDELRVARAARSVATYDADEAAWFRARGVERSTWLDVTLEPAEVPHGGADAQRLLFLGDRRWAPNHEGARWLLRLWPRIADGIRDAELLLVGRSAAPLPVVEGVRELGFVDDLDAIVAGSRAMLAPIRTGGGVRVKILEAVAAGMPVVGTSAAIGSLQALLPLAAVDDEDAFVEAARAVLLDAAGAARAGRALYDANAEHWAAGGPHRSVERWLA